MNMTKFLTLEQMDCWKILPRKSFSFELKEAHFQQKAVAEDSSVTAFSYIMMMRKEQFLSFDRRNFISFLT